MTVQSNSNAKMEYMWNYLIIIGSLKIGNK